jgi:hypothetical protein
MVLLRESQDTARLCGTVPAYISQEAAKRSRLDSRDQDGFRIMGRRDAGGLRLIRRNGHDFSERFPFINLAIGALPAKSCLIDGEAIVTNEAGLLTSRSCGSAASMPRPS